MRPWLCMLGLLAACGGATPQPDTPQSQPEPVVAAPTRPDPVALLPRETVGVVTVDVPLLRASPHWPVLRDLYASSLSEAPERRRALDELLEKAERVEQALVAGGGSVPIELGAVVVQGRFERGDGARLLAQLADERAAARMNPVQVEGRPGLGDGEAALVEVDQGLYLVGPYRRIRPPLRSPERPPALGGSVVRELLAQVPAEGAALHGWLDVPGGVDSLPVPAWVHEILSVVEAVAARVDLSAGLDALLRARMSSPAAADRVARELSAKVDTLAPSMIVRALGLDSVFSALELNAAGGDVVVRLQLGVDELAPIVEWLARVAEAR